MAHHKTFFVNLHDLCSCYGVTPCSYLFPDIECPHFRLMVDTMVYNVGRPEQLKSQAEMSMLGAKACIGRQLL